MHSLKLPLHGHALGPVYYSPVAHGYHALVQAASTLRLYEAFITPHKGVYQRPMTFHQAPPMPSQTVM